MLTDYAAWFGALTKWLPRAATTDRIGLSELQPGVWCGRHTHLSPGAQLRPPCWLGESVWIGPDAVIGPETIVEDRAFVDTSTEIAHSVVGPDTYVGQWARVCDSLVAGTTLINWRTASCSNVGDAFLLDTLGSRQLPAKRVTFWARVAAVLGMGLTLPFAALAMAKALRRGQPALAPRLAVRPPVEVARGDDATLVYYELPGAEGWMRRWPQLWSIARGHFAWVGNRPLSPAEAARLANDFERLWLQAPIGLVSLADANACADGLGDDACAHAGFYAVRANRQLDRSILLRTALTRLGHPRRIRAPREYGAPLSRLAKAQGLLER
jgi:hypothetical protein